MQRFSYNKKVKIKDIIKHLLLIPRKFNIFNQDIS
jgi:hypothetical protein